MTTNLHQLRPAAAVKTCAWCHHDFSTTPELLDHVVDEHLAA